MRVGIRYPITHYVYRPVSMPLASVLSGTRATPTQITWLSALFALAGAVAFGFGAYRGGALLTLVAGITDCVDGDLARMTGRTSRSGAFLDSVLDRWTDAALILGLAASNLDALAAPAGAALVCSLLTSYTRARAQSLGVDCPEGIGGRDARILVLVVAALLNEVFAGLIVVAVLGAITSVHRMILAAHRLDRLDRGDPT